MSEDAVTGAPVACSGDTYIAVPITMPVSVRWDAWAARTAVAMPKSVIFVVPPAARSRLPGLMSRCTMSAWWAVSSARAACPMMSSVASGKAAGPGQDRRQRLPVDQFHDQVGAAELGGLAVVVHPRDTRVGQAGRIPRLGAEPGEECLVTRPPRGQQLHRHRAVEQLVLAAPHLAHAARRYPAGQPVAAGQQVVGHFVLRYAR